MPENKYSTARIVLIDEMLRKRNFVKTQEIVDECLRKFQTHVDRRTVQKDIEHMKDDPPFGKGAPIAYNHSKKAYYYAEDFVLDKVRLSDEEIRALELAAGLIYQFKDQGFLKLVSAAIEKVKWGVSMVGNIDGTDALYTKLRPESIDGLFWQKHFSTVMAALDSHRKLLVEYRKFEDELSTQRIVHPYLLKEYLNRWYIVGYCELRQSLRSFGLDRIQAIEVLEDAMPEQDSQFDPDEYFKYAFGVTGSTKPPLEIELRFKPKAGKYILTVPIHHSQKVIENTPMGLRISILVYPTEEVYMKILGYGTDVVVISPLEVVEEVRLRLKSALEQY